MCRASNVFGKLPECQKWIGNAFTPHPSFEEEVGNHTCLSSQRQWLSHGWDTTPLGFSPVSTVSTLKMCFTKAKTEAYGVKAGVKSSLGVSIFSFKAELFYLSLTHLWQDSHNLFFFSSIWTPIPFRSSIFCPPPSDCIFPFVTDFGTIPLQITFPKGKRLLLSLQPCQPTPTLSFFLFHPHLPLSLRLRHSKQIDTVSGFLLLFKLIQCNPGLSASWPAALWSTLSPNKMIIDDQGSSECPPCR